MRRMTCVSVAAVVALLCGAAGNSPKQPPAEKPKDTITIPADYTKGEKAEYQVTLKVIQHSTKGDKPEQTSFPVTAEALEADKEHTVLVLTAKPPVVSSIPLGLRNDFGETLVLHNGFAPRISVKASDGASTIENLPDAKAAVPRVIEGRLALEKRAGLKDDELGPLKKALESTLGGEDGIEPEADKLATLWYSPMYATGAGGPGTSEDFETSLGEGLTAKGKRTFTYSRTASGGYKMVIDGTVDATALPDLVIKMVEKSGTKLSEADIKKIKADKTQQIRSVSEYTTDKRGWLIRAKTVVTNRLGGGGKTIETSVERKGEVKPPAK